MGNRFEKFRLLMWKNWVLQYRRPIQTIIEVLVPLIFTVILVVVRSLVDPKDKEQTNYTPNDLLSDSWNIRSLRNILYYPNDSNVRNVMERFHRMGPLRYNTNPVSTEEELVTEFDSSTTLAGILIEGLKDFSNLQNVKVSLRFPAKFSLEQDWQTDQKFPKFPTQGPGPKADTASDYYRKGFLTLQNMFTKGLALAINNATNEDLTACEFPKVNMQGYPYPAYRSDPLLDVLKNMLGFILMLSFVYFGINTVKAITTEKEKQLKESMKIMGLPNWLHWIAWFVKCFIFLFLSVTLMVILLKVHFYSHTDYTIFTYSDPTVMLFFLSLFICANITFCFALSTFFSKANTAAAVTGLVWFLSYFPYMLTQRHYDDLSLFTKIICCLASNSAVAFGFQTIVMFEGSGEGIHWSNMFSQVTQDDTFTLGHAMIMLIIDAILYLLIALYVEAVFPGEYGVPLPWNFFLKPSYWRKATTSYYDDRHSWQMMNGEYFEEEPANLRKGIEIRKLCKTFGYKTAVSDLSLNMYQDQITVLLGHNGAGKTTTMSMLTGMFPPTRGTALVNGYDICTSIDNVRDSLGLCPQHNIIFDDLTVAEHIYFFSKLKGLSKDEIEEEINKFLRLLELEDKRNAKSSTLSGGMKRKLSVAIALCGNSKVVMLDEPTAGMDPSARRALWNLLQTQKKGRTMLLSTHFMDEADLLGDRIAIMAGGKLQCCGSSFFLKKKYGAGYSLIMDKTQTCKVDQVTCLLKKHIPDIKVEGNIGSELSFLLPENQSSLFEKMLSDLEDASAQLGINSYGISLTTLEEVFMKVGADHGDDDENGVDDNRNRTNETIVDLKLSTPTTTRMGLIVNQFKSMFLKKYTAIVRSRILLILQLLMPTIFLIITINVVRSLVKNSDLPALPLNLDPYEDPITLLNTANVYDGELYTSAAEHKITYSTNITEEILKITKRNPVTVKKRYIAGATFYNECFVTAWTNSEPFHSAGISVSLVLDTIFKKFTGNKENKLEFINAPLPFDKEAKDKKDIDLQSAGIQYAFNLAFSMSFVAAFYVLFIIRENISKSKHLQFVSGAKIWIFWTTSAICDTLTYWATALLVLITFAATQIEGYSKIDELVCSTILLLCFGWSFLPLMYLSSSLFSTASTGYTRMTMINIFTGGAAYLVVIILRTPSLDLGNLGDVLDSIFLFIPHYSLASGFSNMQDLHTKATSCQKNIGNCADFNDNLYAWESPGVGRNILISIIDGFIFYAFLYAKEYRLFSRILYFIDQKYFAKTPIPVVDEDSDVAQEKHMIHKSSEADLQREYTIVVKDLTKYYKKFLAVNGVSLGVKRYECFGLLGINGAGKTTTFKMMTGDIPISYGDAFVNGYSIKSQHQEVQKVIGYCPQFDALLDDMTARETLKMFALLRGIPSEETNALAEYLSQEFDFHKHLDKLVKQMSGGNKRKLSTAIALIGDPPVLYLDEPTAGMDVATKRYLWNALCKFRDSGKCIILTSHSMEECEALCTRLAIMVNGNFKCLGSTQHLKNKFAAGYTLIVKVKKSRDRNIDATINIDAYVKRHFRGVHLREKHQELMTYYITDKSVPWSKMFGIMERGKQNDPIIEDYSLGQSSLEQVFLTFTKYQKDDSLET